MPLLTEREESASLIDQSSLTKHSDFNNLLKLVKSPTD